jgi:hypothetical protein
MSGIGARLQRIDVRILYWVLMLLVAWPMISPLGIPIPVSQPVKDFTNIIDATPPGSNILVDISFSPTSYPVLPGVAALMEYLGEHDFKIVFVSGVETSPIAFTEKCEPPLKAAGFTYGENYVWYGFISGMETYVARLAENVPNLLGSDFYGTSTKNIPMMADIEDYTDFELVITIDTAEWPDWYVKHWQSRGIKVISMAPAFYFSRWNLLWQQKLLDGFIGSARAAAEFESLINKPGEAAVTTDTLSTSHLWLVILIIIGNIGFILERSSSPEEKR